ncbi:MAG: hypothetical protein KIT46_08415 [Anaerolineales bacterium]|nr:hypothetical protein [Anaerolineales bacterium]MCW5856054.1 hypothetical protein [Anaerolineales bacterium]
MYEWFQSLTGAWGRPLLDWYLANSWVNLPLIGYGIFLLLAWRNYDLIEQRLVDSWLAQAKDKKGKAKLPSQPETDWDAAVAGLSYPFLAQRGYLWLHKNTAENAAKIINLHRVRTRAEWRLERM